MKKFLTIGSLGLVVLAILALAFANTQYGRVIIGVYSINAGLSKPVPKAPPIGRWHAVYTAEFAKKHNLPPENITTNLSEGVDYMEMETLPRIGYQPYTMCMVNMLVQKPHDISMWGMEDRFPKVADDRKLLHLIDIQKYQGQLKILSSMQASSYNYHPEKIGFTSGSKGFFAENVLEDYDYFSVNYDCRQVPAHPQYYPDGYSFRTRKASVWGNYEMEYNGYSDPDWPANIEPEDAWFYIPIPKEIILNIFDKL